MKVFPVGTIVIFENCNTFLGLNGQEATITELPKTRTDSFGKTEFAYKTDYKYLGHIVCPNLDQVRPKKFPPNTDFTSFLNKITKPMSDEEMSKLRREDVVKEKA